MTTISTQPQPHADQHREHRLAHFPVAFFSSVMGLSGLAIVSMKAAAPLGLPTALPGVLAALSAAAFVLIAAFYALKVVRFPAAVVAEFNHPVKLNFFPTISISLVLLSIVARPYEPAWSQALLLVGAPLNLVFTLAVLHYWFNREHFQTVHLSPAWFIPIVGNVLVPISGVELGFVEVSWFFFSIGIVFWIVLLTIIVNRVLFHNPLPERLAPTLFILIAPPAVGFLGYVSLTGGLDPFARMLFHFALFMTLFLLTQVPRLARMQFYLSWWAYSFPLAAITTATFVMHAKTGEPMFLWLASALAALAALVIGFLFLRTLKAIWGNEICQPE